MKPLNSSSTYLVDDARAGAGHMIDRARAAYAAGLEGLVRGRPPRHVRALLPELADPGPSHRRVARPALRRPLPAAPLAPAWWSPSRSGRWPPSALARSCSNAPSAEARTSSARWASLSTGGAGASRQPWPPYGPSWRATWSTTPTARGALRRARISPTPPEPVEIWIGGAGPKALARAARLGDTWYAGPGADRRRRRAEAGPSTWTTAPTRRADRCAGTSTSAPTRPTWPGSREPLEQKGYRGFDLAALVTGTPEQVAERFLSLGERGFDEIVVRQLSFEQTDALASLERLAEVRRLVAAG